MTAVLTCGAPLDGRVHRGCPARVQQRVRDAKERLSEVRVLVKGQLDDEARAIAVEAGSERGRGAQQQQRPALAA